MPGVERLCSWTAAARGRGVRGAGHPGDGAVPGDRPSLKTPDGREALNPEGLVPRVVRELKRASPIWA
jgi:porphobilinogen synthase